ncbi:TetR family transcriptional regulator [Brevibacillus brevis]|nr:TetR family transcriptional regulator [Brevibacillus brevis]VEF89392.1 mycofactocin system transcriptional regulator [Brevibacillus brevis]
MGMHSLPEHRVIVITGADHKPTLTLFIKKGYHATSIDDVAKQAEISKGLLYDYYKGKITESEIIGFAKSRMRKKTRQLCEVIERAFGL